MHKTCVEFEIYNDLYKNDFYVFFEKIIKKTFFHKLDITNQLGDFLEKNNLSNKNIIYNKKDYAIVYVNPIITDFDFDLYAVCDIRDPNRHFVGVKVKNVGYSTNINIFGFFLYFGKTNNVVDIVIVPRQIFQYDWRNGVIDENNTFLYNQSLVFLESHRDGHYQFTVCCFTYDDIFIGSHQDFTKIRSDYYCNNYKILNRMLILPDKKTKNIYGVDLASVKITESENQKRNGYKKNKIMSYDIYEVSSSLLDEFISNSSNFPEESYGDSYPNICPKCNNSTNIASVHYNTHVSMYLGKGYCHNCEIRYSFTDKSWNCCKQILCIDEYCNNYKRIYEICGKKLDSNFICHETHDEDKLIITREKYNEKKPYKNGLYLSVKDYCKSDCVEETY
jgi:hypothetical protein